MRPDCKVNSRLWSEFRFEILFWQYFCSCSCLSSRYSLEYYIVSQIANPQEPIIRYALVLSLRDGYRLYTVLNGIIILISSNYDQMNARQLVAVIDVCTRFAACFDKWQGWVEGLYSNGISKEKANFKPVCMTAVPFHIRTRF